MRARILIAEDDFRQAEVIRRYVESEGHQALVVHDGRAAIDTVRQQRPDVLVLDVMMPKVGGLDVCRVLRGESDLPILMLTARDSEDDMLLGLDLGADDYLTKPYSPRELMARVRTLLRRVPRGWADPADQAMRIGQLTVDPVRHAVSFADRPVACTPGEFAILAALAAHPDRVFTRQQLREFTGGWDNFSTDRTVDMHILNLRKKLEPEPRRPAYLITVYGVGYRLTDGSGQASGGPHAP